MRALYTKYIFYNFIKKKRKKKDIPLIPFIIPFHLIGKRDQIIDIPNKERQENRLVKKLMHEHNVVLA